MRIGGVLNPDDLLRGGRPRGDRVVVLPLLQAQATAFGIVIPDEHRERPQEGIVIAVSKRGYGQGPESGAQIGVDSKPGDRVQFGKYSGQEVILGGARILIMRDHEVLFGWEEADATFNPETDVTVHDNDWKKVHLKELTCEFCNRPSGEDRLNSLREAAFGDQRTGLDDGPPQSIIVPR